MKSKINQESFVKDYNNGLTNAQLAEKYDVHDRTIEKVAARFRAKGLIDYKKYTIKSKIFGKVDNKEIVSQKELLKLLALYETKTAVAEKLGVGKSTITKLCQDYNIIDSTTHSKLLVESLHELTKDIKPYEAAKTHSHITGETLVIQLTDWHAGKIVKDQQGNILYNEAIFKRRMDKFCVQILKLLDNHIKKGTKINDVVVISTGDNANGEDIYATQAYEQELAPPYQVMLVVEVFTKLIQALLDRKLNVKFYGVKGNHGRLGKDKDPNSNWDIMIYLILKHWAYANQKKVEINYSELDYLNFEIERWKYHIRHIAPEQTDTSASRARFGGWAGMHNADAIVYGHYHHFGIMDANGVRVFRGGSPIGADEFAESLAKEADPIQLVWGVSKDRILTFSYAVDLADI